MTSVDISDAQLESELAKMGISCRDMRYAVRAVDRICDSDEALDRMAVAEFVGAAAAIGDLHREQILLVGSSLAHAARKVWQR